MRQKSIRLPAPLDDELIQLSETEGVDQSELVRWGLVLLFQTLRQTPIPLREVIQEARRLEQGESAEEKK